MTSETQALLERARDDERFADPATHQVIAELASAVESLIKERDALELERNIYRDKADTFGRACAEKDEERDRMDGPCSAECAAKASDAVERVDGPCDICGKTLAQHNMGHGVPMCGIYPVYRAPRASMPDTSRQAGEVERAGSELATIAFNMAQRSHLHPDERRILKEAQERWDAARTATQTKKD